MVDAGQFVRVGGGGTEKGRIGGGCRGAVLLPRPQNQVGDARSAVGAAIPPTLFFRGGSEIPRDQRRRRDGSDPVSDDGAAGGYLSPGWGEPRQQ